MKRLSFVLSLAISMWGCDGGNGSSVPTFPSLPAGAGPSYTVSGVVFVQTATGPSPVQGVLVEETNLHHRTTTDEKGAYSISGLYALGNAVTANKIGYGSYTRNVQVSGDTRLDFPIVHLAINALSGVVSEMTSTGLAPIEGVRLDVWSCETAGCQIYNTFLGGTTDISQSATTDKNGFYSFSGLYASKNNILWLDKAGFQDPTGSLTLDGGHSVPINGDTRFDAQLVRR